MLNDALFSTGKDDWETPHGLFASLHLEFNFTLDLAANGLNHKTPRWIGLGGGLTPNLLNYAIPRNERCWLNPPYSRGLQARFVRKAASSGAFVVCLLPARTDTRLFHEVIWDLESHQPRAGVEVRFLRGRLKFVGAPSSAPFPSMIVVFGRV